MSAFYSDLRRQHTIAIIDREGEVGQCGRREVGCFRRSGDGQLRFERAYASSLPQKITRYFVSLTLLMILFYLAI